MAVPNTYTPAQYNCNGSTVAFPFTFGVGATSEIEVILTDANGVETILTETTHYTVSAVNNDYESGGTVTTVATYASGNKITIRINVPLTQDTDFVEGMPTLYESFENGLDKLTRIAQQLNEGRERTLIVPKTESSALSRVIPSATTRAGKMLGFDASGQPVAVTDVEGITLTTFGNALVSSIDAATARTTLEAYSADETDTAIDTAKDTAIAETSNLLEFTNLNFTATAASKALTIALKGVDGNNPSATNKVIIPFRSATLTSGIITKRTVTSALSLVLSSGSTLGFGAAEAGRIYVWAIDNAGTVELALSRTADIFPESNLVNTTAEGGAGGSDSATVMYSNTARSNLACRCIGYIEITTGATAGEWDNAATKIQVMGPGVHRTGDIVQTQAQYLTSSGATGTTIPLDNTIPQITEGAEVLSKAITPTSVMNHLYFNAQVIVDDGSQDIACLAIFEGETANAFAASFASISAILPNILTLEAHKIAPAVTSTTYTVRVGAGTTSTYWNRQAAGDAYGGVATSFLRITEVFA